MSFNNQNPKRPFSRQPANKSKLINTFCVDDVHIVLTSAIYYECTATLLVDFQSNIHL